MSESDHSGSAPPTPGSAGSQSPPGSPQSGSHGSGSVRSGSPASRGSDSAPASPGSVASQSPEHSPVASPVSVKSGSASPRSGSPHSHRSGSPQSPGSHRSRSGSPASQRSRSHSGSPARQPSRSPSEGHRSRSGSVHSQRSQSGSPEAHHSGSASPGSHRSRSGSPRGSVKSRSHSRSVSPAGSRHSRSRSASPAGSSRSGSRSGSGSRSRSRSPAGSAKSGSASPAKSGSASPAGSGSPRSVRSGSPSSEVGTKKKRHILDSDDEDGGSPRPGTEITATADDLFGDASDISSDEDARGGGSGGSGGEGRASDAASGDEQKPVIEDEENQEPEEIPETRIEVEIPKVNTDLGKAIHFVKLPNFLSVETRPFDPVTYEDEVDDEDVMDEEGRTRLRLKVENTVRWRPVRDDDGNEMKDALGNTERESNARVVKWSDGSMSLHLGNEIFDVHTMLLQGDFNHLFIRQGTGLQGQAVFRTKLSFRPHSTDSFTHRKITMSLADKSAKKQKLKVLPIAGADPESHRSEMIKKEEERLRASVRREAQQKRVKERAHARGGLSAPYLEDDDDDNSFSIGALKRAYKDKRAGKSAGKANPHIYSSDDESSEDFSEDEKKSKKLMKAKRLQDTDDEDSEKSDSRSDSESPKKRARVESSDEDSAGGSPKSSPKPGVQESESDG